MIFTKLAIKNIFCFSDTEIDLTIKRRPIEKNGTWDILDGTNNFIYKKSIIMLGANSSGKTSFGKILCYIQNFVRGQVLNDYLKICYKNADAQIDVEFATPSFIDSSLIKPMLHRLIIRFNSTNSKIDFEYGCVKIGSNDTYLSAHKKLKIFFKKQKTMIGDGIFQCPIYFNTFDEKKNITQNHLSWQLGFNTGLKNIGWYYLLTENISEKFSTFHHEYIEAKDLENILKIFDPSIKNVKKLVVDDDYLNKDKITRGFSVIFDNDDSALIDHDGEIVNKERFSRGTLEAIKVSDVLCRIRRDKNESKGASIYYLDELLVHCHSEIEQYIVYSIIRNLPKTAQFFYTTHNYDIFLMNIPAQSYIFFLKEVSDTKAIRTDNYKGINERKLWIYMQNDIFNINPKTSGLDIFYDSF